MSAQLDTMQVTRAMLMAGEAAPDGPRGGRPKRPGKRAARHNHHWTAAEDGILRREWGEVGQRALKAKLRGRSWMAIYKRAEDIGLPGGLPQGYVSLSRAAEILGLCDKNGVLRLAQRQGVITRLHPHPRATRESQRHPWQCVDLDEITAAMQREVTTTEVVSTAARVRDLYPATLRLWLIADGVLTPSAPGGPRLTGRLPSAVIDEVVARHAPAGYGRRAEVARRLGVSESTLRTLLKRAGITGLRLGGGGIPIADAERVVAAHRAAKVAHAPRKREGVRNG